MSTATSNERFWPATFAERGATVPFTTPALAAARLRSMDRIHPAKAAGCGGGVSWLL